MRKEERKKRDDASVSIEESSGNVFADLGLKNPEELLAKAQIVQRIADIIAERKLTQARAAKVLGIDQPKVSALLRGKLDGFWACKKYCVTVGNRVFPPILLSLRRFSHGCDFDRQGPAARD